MGIVGDDLKLVTLLIDYDSHSIVYFISHGLPCSLFLYGHLLDSSMRSLSWPKAELTKPFTKDEAKFCRAESTVLGPIVVPEINEVVFILCIMTH